MTSLCLPSHNPRVRFALLRAVIALALAPCLVLGPVMPQEHVHDADESHPHVVAHSHVSFHQHEDAHHAATVDHDRPEMGTDDDRVVWVNGASLTPRAFHFVADWAAVEARSTAATSVAAATRQPDIDSSPPHGPPRPSFSLRGPPFASA